MQLVGRVDVPATLASISAGEESAYSEVEACLVRMEALTTLRPACSAQHADMYKCAAQLEWRTLRLFGREPPVLRVPIPAKLHFIVSGCSRECPPVFKVSSSCHV